MQDLIPLLWLCLNCPGVISISKCFFNKCPAKPPAWTLKSEKKSWTLKSEKKINITPFLLKYLPWLSRHSYLCFLSPPTSVALNCAFEWKCITQGTCGGVKLVRISWSHPISASSRQGGEIFSYEQSHTFCFSQSKVWEEGSFTVVVSTRELCLFVNIFLKTVIECINKHR